MGWWTIVRYALFFIGVCAILGEVARYMLRNMRDSCEEPGCRGHLRYLEDRRYQGEVVAAWGCTKCDFEILVKRHGSDIVRSTDPGMIP